MSILGSIVGAVGSLVGGALSDKSNRKVASATNDRSYEIAQEDRTLQREFARSGIQWRAEDAKAAGLHPLYALGGTGATYTPSPISLVTPDQSGFGRGLAEAGQNLGRAIQAQETPQQREARQWQMALLKAQVGREVALTGLYESEAARNRQSALQSAGIPEGSVSVGALEGIPGQVKSVPDEVTSARIGSPELSAGQHPFFMEAKLGNGLRIMLPRSEDMGESLEAIQWYMWPAIIAANEKRYGKGWTREVMQHFLGFAPPDNFSIASDVRAMKRLSSRVLKFLRSQATGIPHVRSK